MYKIHFTSSAIKDLSRLQKTDQKAFRKLETLIEELREHPTLGTGKPKPLGKNRAGQWSRRITGKHRLVYSIEDKEIIVFILSVMGHYDDK